MRCPCCNEELVIGELRSYETLCEHVADPNGDRPKRETYVCPDPGCVLHDNVFWNPMGEGYILDYKNSEFIHNHCKDGLIDAMGTFARKLEAESAWRSWSFYYRGKDYKKDTILKLGKHRWSKNWNVTADEEGNIVKKSWKLQHSYDGVVYSGNFEMLNFCIRQFFKVKSWKDHDQILKEAKDKISKHWILDNDFPWYWGRVHWYRILNYWFIFTYFKILRLK